jgi:hypothetical protein
MDDPSPFISCAGAALPHPSEEPIPVPFRCLRCPLPQRQPCPTEDGNMECGRRSVPSVATSVPRRRRGGRAECGRSCEAFRAAKHRLRLRSVDGKQRNRPERAVLSMRPLALRCDPLLRQREAEHCFNSGDRRWTTHRAGAACGGAPTGVRFPRFHWISLFADTIMIIFQIQDRLTM